MIFIREDEWMSERTDEYLMVSISCSYFKYPAIAVYVNSLDIVAMVFKYSFRENIESEKRVGMKVKVAASSWNGVVGPLWWKRMFVGFSRNFEIEYNEMVKSPCIYWRPVGGCLFAEDVWNAFKIINIPIRPSKKSLFIFAQLLVVGDL